ncbi:ABC transporter permease [Nocardioidaceae bacterium SCSIO 66511]|nr:ABC transporter permease [Nocardioidaceae bacterium SCSIO 66511]
MFGYIVRRVIAGLLVLLVISFGVYLFFFYGPTDPALAYCPKGSCTGDDLARIRDNFGLDEPVLQQYGEYLKGIFVGRDIANGANVIHCPAPCLGQSFKYSVLVTPFLWDLFPATLSIAVGSAVVFLVVGVTIGIISARKRGTALDRGLVGTAMLVTAMPYYLVALLAFLYLFSQWGLFPEPGYYPLTEDGPVAWFKGLLLPWLALGLFTSTAYARYSRGSMIEALGEDYVRTARAKGLRDRTVALKHGLRAAVVPVVTIFGLDFAAILAGTIFTEKIFRVRGIGLQALESITNKDLPIVSATVLFAAACVVVMNILVDLAYAVLDPRVRL